MKVLHTVGIILFTLCIVGCSSGGNGGEAMQDAADFRALDMTLDYDFGGNNPIDRGDDLIIVLNGQSNSNKSFDGTCEIKIEYRAVDGSTGELSVINTSSVDIDIAGLGSFSETINMGSRLGAGTYEFNVIIAAQSTGDSLAEGETGAVLVINSGTLIAPAGTN